MAKANEKKKNVQNQKILNNHLMISLGIYVLYALYRLIYHYSSLSKTVMTLFVISTLVFAYSLRSIKNSAAPLIDDRGNMTVLTDLTKVSGSLMEYLFDVVYVQWIVLVLGMWSDKVWWLWAIVPLFAVYKVLSFVLPFLRGTGGIPGMPGMPTPGMMMNRGSGGGANDDSDDDGDAADKKRLDKRQRKEEMQQKRMKNVRM